MERYGVNKKKVHLLLCVSLLFFFFNKNRHRSVLSVSEDHFGHHPGLLKIAGVHLHLGAKVAYLFARFQIHHVTVMLHKTVLARYFSTDDAFYGDQTHPPAIRQEPMVVRGASGGNHQLSGAMRTFVE
jgi:hypothetical protein